MSLWPAVQKKAQEELDAAVGRDRLPTYADIVELPYLNAIYLETLRWNQVVPLGEWLTAVLHMDTLLRTVFKGVPHAISEDDVYEGYYIPANTTILVNAWYVYNHNLSYIYHRSMMSVNAGQC